MDCTYVYIKKWTKSVEKCHLMGGETKSSDDLSSKDTNHFIFAKIMANDKSDSKTLKLFDSSAVDWAVDMCSP
jgi:hypothetical protein